MANNIAPLQLPDWRPAPMVDWRPLNEIGKSIADYRNKNAIAQAVQQANGNPEAAGNALGAAGFTDQAKQYLSLAEQKAQLAQQLAMHRDTVAQQQAQQAEASRHNQASEGLQGEALRKSGFMPLPDGTVLRTNPNSGIAEPAYSAPPKPLAVAPGTTLVNPNTGEKIYGNDQSMLPPETIDQMARQALAGDTSVFMNLGRGAQAGENIVAVRKRMADINAQAGETGTEQASRNAEYKGAQAGQRVLGTKQAGIEMAATEFNQVIPIVQKASAAVNRTNYPDLNRIVQAFEEKTGDPNIVAFGGGVNTLVNLYARAISPTGAPTVSDKDHAREILNKAWSQGQFDAAVGMMKQEIDAALNSPGKVREEMRKRFVEGAGGQPAQPAAPKFGSVPIPIEAKNKLLEDKDPNARKNFDTVFGEGASARILGPQR